MSEYFKHRIDYINSWPNVELFPVEKQYRVKCDDLKVKGKNLFLPMKMWYSEDRDYNIAISHIMDSLDMMPYYPNHAFLFLFSALDGLLKNKYENKNITACLKLCIIDIDSLQRAHSDVANILNLLFSIIPLRACYFLANTIYTKQIDNKSDGSVELKDSLARNRVIRDENNVLVDERCRIIDAIQRKYLISDKIPKESARDVACLLKKIFIKDEISLVDSNFNITQSFRLHLLLSGLIYSFRNDEAHGNSMAFSKSSLTDMNRYALNYFCFLSAYVILMVLLIMSYINGDKEKEKKYKQLFTITKDNCTSMKEFFGNHLGK